MIRALALTLLVAIAGTATAKERIEDLPVERLLPTATAVQTSEAMSGTTLTEATQDLCGRQVVMLGENGFHGDGKTVAFKVALAQRLIDECGFNAMFFEASHYDFLALGRAARAGEATPEMVSSAVGQKWNQSADFAPLIPYLLEAAQSGRVTLGGLDDQLGSRGAFYSLEGMPADLAAHLPGARASECEEAMRRRIWSDFPPDQPYSTADQIELAKCLNEIRVAASAASSQSDELAEDLQMAANFERALARDFDDQAIQASARARSMFLNFDWLAGSLHEPARVIVWSANEHVATDASSAPNASIFNLGSLIRQRYGDKSFALAFSAASGAFRWSRQENRPIPPAPDGSLEREAVTGSIQDPVYLSSIQLRALGVVPGAIFGHQYMTAPWSEIVDGVVVFRIERPPTAIE